MSHEIVWRQVFGSGGRGMRKHGNHVDWITMSAHKPRRSVGVSAPGLTFTVKGKHVECGYDPSRQPSGGIYPLLLKAHDAGSATIVAHHKGAAAGELRVTICPKQKVTLVARNVVSDVRKQDHGKLAKEAPGLAQALSEVFDSQGAFNFAVTVGSDVHLNGNNLVNHKEKQLVSGKMENVREVFARSADASADFTILFCWGLWDVPCALGVSAGKIILVDETIFHGKLDRHLLTHVLAHEVVHSMGHTKSRFGRTHYDNKKDNLMFPDAKSAANLGPEQVEFIINRNNWYDDIR